MATMPTPDHSEGAIAPDVLSAGSADANRMQGAQRHVAHPEMLLDRVVAERRKGYESGVWRLREYSVESRCVSKLISQQMQLWRQVSEVVVQLHLQLTKRGRELECVKG